MAKMENGSRVTTVIFDWDDTLVDSLDARLATLEQVFSETGITHVTAREFFAKAHGIQISVAFAEMELEIGRELDLTRKFREGYWTKEPGRLRLLPGAGDLVRELHGRGLKLGMVTQKGREFEVEGRMAGAAYEVEELGLGDLFQTIIGIDDVTRPKPHPEGVLLALERMGSSAEETLVIGDSAADMEAARGAGCRSCLATWGISEMGGGGIEASFVAGSPGEVLGLGLFGER